MVKEILGYIGKEVKDTYSSFKARFDQAFDFLKNEQYKPIGDNYSLSHVGIGLNNHAEFVAINNETGEKTEFSAVISSEIKDSFRCLSFEDAQKLCDAEVKSEEEIFDKFE